MDIERQQKIVKINNLYFLKCFYIYNISWGMTLNYRSAIGLLKKKTQIFVICFHCFVFLNVEHFVEENRRGKDTSISKRQSEALLLFLLKDGIEYLFKG